jgi:hypothetical protein
MRVLHVLRFPQVGALRSLSLTHDDRELVVGHDRGISIIATATLIAEHVEGPGAWSAVATLDGTAMYWAAVHSGLYRLNRRTRRVEQVHAAPAPSYLALTPDGKLLYVNYRAGGPGGRPGHDTIGVFDAASGALQTTVNGLANVGGYSVVTPDGRALWASALDACSMARYDHVACPIVPGELINVIETRDHRPQGILALPASTHVAHISFVSEALAIVSGGPGIRFVDTRTLRTRASLPLLRAGACVPDPKRQRAYATLINDSAVGIIRLQTR